MVMILPSQQKYFYLSTSVCVERERDRHTETHSIRQSSHIQSPQLMTIPRCSGYLDKIYIIMIKSRQTTEANRKTVCVCVLGERVWGSFFFFLFSVFFKFLPLVSKQHERTKDKTTKQKKKKKEEKQLLFNLWSYSQQIHEYTDAYLLLLNKSHLQLQHIIPTTLV